MAINVSDTSFFDHFAYATHDGSRRRGQARFHDEEASEETRSFWRELTAELHAAVMELNIPDLPLLVRLINGEITCPELAKELGLNRSTSWKQLKKYLFSIRQQLKQKGYSV